MLLESVTHLICPPSFTALTASTTAATAARMKRFSACWYAEFNCSQCTTPTAVPTPPTTGNIVDGRKKLLWNFSLKKTGYFGPQKDRNRSNEIEDFCTQAGLHGIPLLPPHSVFAVVIIN